MGHLNHRYYSTGSRYIQALLGHLALKQQRFIRASPERERVRRKGSAILSHR